jgi:Protein of unknown function (DUF4236)
MGFRFRRSFTIARGLRWNIGMRSTSIRLGGRGFGVTLGTRGNRATVGAPGTGASYSTRVSGWLLLLVLAVALMLVVVGMI